MVNALGIVVNQAGGTMQTFFDGVHSFKLVQGLAARAGIVSAALAHRGFTGVADPLFSKYGILCIIRQKNCDAEVLTKDLGKSFLR